MSRNSRIIAIANQKGGVGKTTTSVNLAVGLARLKKKVLLMDLDPQGNATMGCGINGRELEPNACDLLLGETVMAEVVVPIPEMGFDLVGANTDLTAAELNLMDVPNRESVLREALQPVRTGYDFILIDCPPSLSMLTINALTAAQGVLIPMQCEYYALEGLTSLLDTIARIQSGVNEELEIEGLLRTMFDVRNNLSTEVSNQLLRHFEDKVFATVIPRNVRVAEAPSHGQSVIDYDPQSRGAIAYLGLAGELIRRNRKRQEQA